MFASTVFGVGFDCHVAAFGECAKAVGEATLGEVRGIGEIGEPHRVVGCVGERNQDRVVHHEKVVFLECSLELR